VSISPREFRTEITLQASWTPWGIKHMNKDQVKGRMDELAGKAKKAAGKVAGDSVLRRKGRATYGEVMEQLREERKKQRNDE
jgi:uncharacterized protein YjbJ (UPF0337 family)